MPEPPATKVSLLRSLLFSLFRPALFLLLSAASFTLFYLNLSAWAEGIFSGIDMRDPLESEPYEVFNAVFSLYNQPSVQVDLKCSPGWYPSSCETKTGLYRGSVDCGISWKNQAAPPGLVLTARQACVPGQPLNCYRLYGGDRILSSQTGGWLWRREWELNSADGRAYFPLPVKVFPDNLLNLAIFRCGAGTGYRVVVARGNQGLLIRREDGTWMRSMGRGDVSVDLAPAYQEADQNGAFIFSLLVSGISYLFFFTASFRSGSTLSRHKFSRSSAAAFFAALALPLAVPGMLLLPLWLLEWGLFPHPILIAFAAFLVLAVYVALPIYLPRKM